MFDGIGENICFAFAVFLRILLCSQDDGLSAVEPVNPVNHFVEPLHLLELFSIYVEQVLLDRGVGANSHDDNGALAFNLTINDIFNTNMERWKMRTSSVEVSKDCNNYGMTRGIRLQVTYKFNTVRSKYKGTGAGNDEKNRL